MIIVYDYLVIVSHLQYRQIKNLLFNENIQVYEKKLKLALNKKQNCNRTAYERSQ